MKKTVGVLGGMGPEATASFLKRVIELTVASCDQEHIPMLIDNNVMIPNRTAYLLDGGESPLVEILKSAVKLEMMGADLIVMPCNTAHYFYNDVKKFIGIPFINMIDEVAKYIKQKTKVNKVGLLATEGTYSAEIYETSFKKLDIDIITPRDEVKKELMRIISEIKKGNKEECFSKFKKIVMSLKKQGVQTIILGCTELSLLHRSLSDDIEINIEKIKLIDPMDILARKVVVLASE
ncbi:MAG: aspartate racemase [Alkaliphilus sp.]|nr:amino acid racemase [bacterium AH-315-K05]MBN4074739.1 amino acid racemase [bacterium AH-315-E09]PHS29150.1 MAG: aspartate racemase [Alkaliphilus sp.]